MRRSANKEVIKEVALNVTAVRSEEAIRLADEGKREEAARVFEDNARLLRETKKTYDTVLVHQVSKN